jgi:hypothetical protein
MTRAPGLAVLLALLLVLGPACTLNRISMGRPLGPTDAALVAPGAAEADVLERLGPPEVVSRRPTGPAFEYAYSSETGRALDVSFFHGSFHYEEAHRLTDRLVVAFDPRGLVSDVSVVRQTEPPPEVPGDR